MVDLPYGFRVRLVGTFQDVLRRVGDSLTDHELEILTRVDLREHLQATLAVETGDYVSLTVCNPSLAARALEAEHSAGLLLPGSVIVHADGPGTTIVEAVAPLLLAAERGRNPALMDVAREIDVRLRRALVALEGVQYHAA